MKPMKAKPLVTVIIIFLNAERFIAEAIESVLDQSYDRWELLLVDDGSTDRSSAIARACARHHPDRIRYLQHPRHENRGMSASRNLGLREARGEYVAMLDADDVWLPNKLYEQTTIMAAQPQAAMVYGRTEIWHSWTGNPDDTLLDYTFELGVEPETLIEPPRLLVQLLENKAQTPTTCSALVRRQACEDVGGFEPAFRGRFEDQVFFAKLGLHAPVFVSGACWARYRQHPDSHCAVAKRSGGAGVSRLVLLRWLEQYLKERQVTHEAVWRALRRELRPYDYPVLSRLTARTRRVMRLLQSNLRRQNNSAGIQYFIRTLPTDQG